LGATDEVPPYAPLDVLIVDPEGRERCVPAFVGRGEYRFRYSSELVGAHHYRVDAGGSPAEGVIDVVSDRDATTTLASHGPLRVAASRRHLEHADGTPFLWLADTWWHGLTSRISLTEFCELVQKRVDQGFSVVQLAAGLYPEMAPFAPEGRSDSGWAWTEDFGSPNLAWFDEADERIRALVDNGLVPCLVGMWGYYLQFMNVETMLRHWREVIARWSAYPVVWCLAGESGEVWYDDDARAVEFERWAAASSAEDLWATILGSRQPDKVRQLRELNEVARAVRRLEPFGRLFVVHAFSLPPARRPWEILEEEGLLDCWFLYTGHMGLSTLAPSVNAVCEAVAHRPQKPVIVGEVCYEGMGGSNWQDIQRFLFWTHLLSGAAGHTYGASGVWAFNTTEVPGLISGLCPPWTEAVEFPGAGQVGIGRRVLASLPWQRFEQRPSWVQPHQHEGDRFLPYAAGVAGGPRVFYFPSFAFMQSPAASSSIRLRSLRGRRWRGQLVDPQTGVDGATFVLEPDSDDSARLECGYGGAPGLPSGNDWVLVMTPEGER
jgi:hypothetical protein